MRLSAAASVQRKDQSAWMKSPGVPLKQAAQNVMIKQWPESGKYRCHAEAKG